jgi:hypothetical protein
MTELRDHRDPVRSLDQALKDINRDRERCGLKPLPQALVDLIRGRKQEPKPCA